MDLTCPICQIKYSYKRIPLQLQCEHLSCYTCLKSQQENLLCQVCGKKESRDAEELVERTDLIEIEQQKICQIHKQPIQMACNMHQQKICLSCFFETHKECKEVMPLEQFEEIQKKIKLQKIDQLTEDKVRLSKDIQHLQKMETLTEQIIKEQQYKYSSFCINVVNKVIEETKKQFKQQKQKQQEIINQIVTQKEILHQMIVKIGQISEIQNISIQELDNQIQAIKTQIQACSNLELITQQYIQETLEFKSIQTDVIVNQLQEYQKEQKQIENQRVQKQLQRNKKNKNEGQIINQQDRKIYQKDQIQKYQIQQKYYKQEDLEQQDQIGDENIQINRKNVIEKENLQKLNKKQN